MDRCRALGLGPRLEGRTRTMATTLTPPPVVRQHMAAAVVMTTTTHDDYDDDDGGGVGGRGGRGGGRTTIVRSPMIEQTLSRRPRAHLARTRVLGGYPWWQ